MASTLRSFEYAISLNEVEGRATQISQTNVLLSFIHKSVDFNNNLNPYIWCHFLFVHVLSTAFLYSICTFNMRLGTNLYFIATDNWIEENCHIVGGAPDKIGWAFGLGLERIAMKLFDIPDIRLFWSEDERFLNQFKCGPDVKFKPFSKYPPTYKDVSFWTNDAFTPNDLFEVIRSVAGDYVEEVRLSNISILISLFSIVLDRSHFNV